MKTKTRMMLKRTMSVLLACVLIFGSAPIGTLLGLDLFSMKASAATYSGTCGDNLTWTLDADIGKLVISGTGDMTNWSAYTAPWESYRSYIKTVIIGNSVTSIGDYAFYYCTGLNSITIPDSVTSIGGHAFCLCANLTNITIPDSITSIGDQAFFYCTSLERVTIPDSVTSIGDYAFYNCTSLESVTIGRSVTSIGDMAFYYCKSLTSITIPNSVASIGYMAFCGCDGLTSVTIGNGVTSIGGYAFYNCVSLESVTIGCSVASIGDMAFYCCDSLETLYYTGTPEQWGKISIGANNQPLIGSTIYYNVHIHTYSSVITRLPTCSQSGLITYTCKCGDSYTEVIKATGHTKGEWEYIDTNEYAKLCTVCGEKLESKMVTVNMLLNGENVNKKQVLNKSTSIITANVTDNFTSDVVFVSSDDSIVSFDSNDNIVANNIGKATITVTINGTAISDSIEIEVLPRDFTITWIVNRTETVQTVKEYEEIIPDVNTKVDGYMFKGWNNEVPETMPSNNLTFTAVLEEIVTVSEIVFKVPTKTEYIYKKETLDLTGIEILVIYSDGTKEIVTDTSKMTVSGFSNEKRGEQTVTVEYEGLTAEFNVTVKYAWWQWILIIFLFGWIWY